MSDILTKLIDEALQANIDVAKLAKDYAKAKEEKTYKENLEARRKENQNLDKLINHKIKKIKESVKVKYYEELDKIHAIEQNAIKKLDLETKETEERLITEVIQSLRTQGIFPKYKLDYEEMLEEEERELKIKKEKEYEEDRKAEEARRFRREFLKENGRSYGSYNG